MLAYTEFVWMFLQLHMAESPINKIIQSDILYGIVFRSLWSYFGWITERGY